jgi:exosortase D (VPLPA-CTERM-specific)
MELLGGGDVRESFNHMKGLKPAGLLLTFFTLCLLFFLYRSALTYLLAAWQGDEFSYCWVVPPVVLYLIWDKREQLMALHSRPSWWGLAPLCLGVLLFWLGELGGEFTMLFLSLWLVIVSLCWLQLGWRKLKTISFPLLFGLACFVPPNAIYVPLTFRLKLISSWLGVKMLQLYGLSAFREGNVIDLGFTQLQVVDACSGLRYVIPLFLMGLLLAHYFRAPLWQRLLLVVSTLPLSIITNSLRIASVGFFYQYLGQAAAEGFFHDFSGWFIFMAGLAFLLLEIWILKRVFRSQESEGRRQKAEDRRQESEDRSQKTEGAPHPSRLTPHALVALVLLLATLAVAQTVNFRESTPLRHTLSAFPLQLGAWQGTRSAMEQQFLDTLKLSDYALVDYRDQGGREVSLYVAFNSSQCKGEATHSPATCLPGSGWEFTKAEVVPLPLGDGRSIRINRAFMEKSGARQLVYYWFPQRGRILTDLYQVKLYNFWDALTRQRTDGALVRIITPVYGTEGAEAAEQRLRGVTKTIVPVLDGFLPK